LKVQGCKLRVFKVYGGYFKTGESSGEFPEVSPKFKNEPFVKKYIFSLKLYFSNTISNMFYQRVAVYRGGSTCGPVGATAPPRSKKKKKKKNYMRYSTFMSSGSHKKKSTAPPSAAALLQAISNLTL
jgi:hypothetical protein